MNDVVKTDGSPLNQETMETLWQLFVQICLFWTNADNVHQYKSRFEAFIINRIEFDSQYRLFYVRAAQGINSLIAAKGEIIGYPFLFTDQSLNTPPAETDWQIARQKVANEFVALQLSLGGFKAFGATNYCGYICGPNIPGEAPPYRPMENVE
jgi:hypothetical protein